MSITLVFLATGASHQDLAFRFQRGKATISNVIAETCNILWNQLSPIYTKLPNSAEQWQQIADGFWERWNFPNCIGSIDGKHFHIQCPKMSGSTFFNYKHTFSTLVLAMCDYNYKFTYVNIGSAGREGDAGVFGQSKLYHSLECNSLHIPPPCLVNGTDVELPYVIVGDEAFPMKKYLMRPYPGRGKNVLPHIQQIFNYRLSRARRIIENCFGILVARWRIFSHPINAKIENCESYIKAAMVLHNHLRTEESNKYTPRDFVDSENMDGSFVPGGWRQEEAGSTGVSGAGRLGTNMHTRSVAELRDNIADFFVTPQGSVSWQNHMVGNT